MHLEASTPAASGEISVPDPLRLEVMQATNEARFWDAYQLALSAGPLELWSGAEAKLLAGRLARHLGSSKLYWNLTAQACRQRPERTLFQAQRVYAVMEKWGIFAANQAARRLDHTESENNEEKAEGLICQGLCRVVFRDFEGARGLFSQAQELAPQSPWIWSESSSLPAEQGDHERALEFADQALALQPYFRPALLRKANYLQSLRRDDEAFQLLHAGCQQLQSSGVINNLIVMCSEREEWAFMLDLVDHSEKLSPLSEEGVQSWFSARRTDALIGLGRLSEARDESLRVTKIPFYKNLGQRLQAEQIAGRRVKIPVPFIQQDYNTCAPATLSAITTFWGNAIPQDTLIGEICYDGTYDFVERRWAEQAGWNVREFKVTWDAAVSLLDRGIPFILTTQEINSGHSQAVIGYDTIRRSLLLRDPSVRHFTEYGYEEFEEHYAPVGPRGLLLLPASQVGIVADVSLPETELYDLTYSLNSALEQHDRERAHAVLQSLLDLAPRHRLTWMARRALAHYDQNPLAHLEAIDGLLELFPEDDRLLHVRLQLLRTMGRNHEAAELLRTRCLKPKVPPLFWREHAQELRHEKKGSETARRLTWRALKWGPHDIDNLTTLSGILWDVQLRQEALGIQHLAACVGDKKEPVSEAYFQMQEACGQTEAGLDFLRRRSGSFLHQSSAPAITLVNALDRLNRSSEAQQVLEDALTVRPEDGDLQLRSARFEAGLGHLEQSQNFLERARATTRPVAWLRAAGHLEQLLGNFDQALEHWRRLADLSPLDVEAHRRIAWLLARRDGKAAALDYVRSLGQHFPCHRGLLELEIGWLRNDVPDEVAARITTYLELNPSDAWARRERVSFLQNRLALEEALAEAREARQFEPHHPASWQVEAGVLEAMNRTGDARDLLKHALELSIESTYALRRLVLLADTPKEKEEALHFIWEQFERQSVSGPAIPVYREVAFPILEITDLSSNLRILWEQRPDLWESWHTLLHQLIAVGELDQAGRVAAGAAQRFPTLPVVWRDAARLNQRLSAWPEATECLLHALRINPDWAPVVCDLAGIYRRTAKWEEARELLERSHRRNPMEATVLGNLADLLWHIEEREAAIAQVTRAVEINPDYNWGWNTLAQWSVLLRQNNIALEMARERAKRLGKDASAWLLVSRLAQRPELAGERLDAALRACECEPRNIDAHDTSALALAEQRRFEEALKACHPSAFGTRAPVPLRGREAWLLAQQGKRAEAMNKMKEVVAQDPSYLWGWDRLADWHFEANNFLDSLNACEKVLRLSPMEPSAYGKRARAYIKLTKSKEAKLDYQKALALDPGYTFAGWQLFLMQLGEKDYAGAAATLFLMRSRCSPGVILPAEIILAGKQSLWDKALSTLRQVALLLEVDTGAVQEAFNVLDAGHQQQAVDKLLTSLISNPELNPYIANIWANRINLVTKWNLFSYLKKIPAKSRALEAVLQNVVLGSKKTSHPLRLANRLIAKYPEATRRQTQVWSALGQIFVSGTRWNQAADWLKDWESRPDVQGWMVTNLVFSLQILGRIQEADGISQKLLSKGLRDHTAAYHLLYLTLSALERQDTGQARQLFQSVHLESNQKQDEFFKLAVEQALLVQEAPPGPERHAASAQARHQLSHFAMSERKSQRVKKAETRVTLQIAKDSKTFASSFYAFRIRLGSGFSPVLRNRFLRVIAILLLINALRMCSAAH